MTPKRENDWILASDRLRARKSGPWAKEKLSFLDQYLPAALQATSQKRSRWYIDLFAGPGRNIIKSTREEFDGSVIRALPLCAQQNASIHFTDAVVVNKSKRDHAALVERIARLRADGDCRVPDRNLTVLTSDANIVIESIMKRVNVRAYAFVFVDITAPTQLPWTTIAELKRQGHESVDLYLLFPLGMAIQRLIGSWNPETVEQCAPALDSFYGTTEWRGLIDLRTTDSQSAVLQRAALQLYMDRLVGLGWRHVLVSRDVRRAGSIGMYKMIFATNHDAGAQIGNWTRHNPRADGQGVFDFLD